MNKPGMVWADARQYADGAMKHGIGAVGYRNLRRRKTDAMKEREKLQSMTPAQHVARLRQLLAEESRLTDARRRLYREVRQHTAYLQAKATPPDWARTGRFTWAEVWTACTSAHPRHTREAQAKWTREASRAKGQSLIRKGALAKLTEVERHELGLFFA